MTQAEWLRGKSPGKLLNFLRQAATERKLLLAACACCRRNWGHLTDERSRYAIELVKRYADGLAGTDELRSALQPARDVCLETTEKRAGSIGQRRAQVRVFRSAVHLLEAALAPRKELIEQAMFVTWEGLSRTQQQGLRAFECATLRHILGNPFDKARKSSEWPATGVALAQSMYLGDACHFALHDALHEAGHDTLAEHFREPYHPKGCWALDLILGKS
jgi:hypothetical protein